MEIPIACSLSSDAARDQVTEWVELCRRASRVDRVSPTRVDVHLKVDAATLGDTAVLAAKEKACCPFFSFRIDIGANDAVLVIEVPSESSAVFDEFVTTIAHR